MKKFTESLEQEDVFEPQSLDGTILRVIWDDWMGLYLNGELLTEGHSFNTSDVIKKLIKGNISMGNMKYGSIHIIKDGRLVDLPTGEDGFELYQSIPKTAEEYFDGLEKAGYEYKINIDV